MGRLIDRGTGTNTNLHDAKRGKNDEFYTTIEVINNELTRYDEHFRGKVVFCNCDDPEESKFWWYFKMKFHYLGLKKLIATHFDYVNPTYKLETSKVAYTGEIAPEDLIKTPLKSNGDFRSEECIELLKESDVVVTNPPFSLFREYIAQLVKYDKKFLIIGNMNAVTYKDVFKLIMQNKVWLGVTKPKELRMHDSYPLLGSRYINEDGHKIAKFGNLCWFTNLEHKHRNEKLFLYQKYNPKDYPKYDNYDAIEVRRVSQIPCDWDGPMGVPITFLEKYNPEQFEILGATESEGKGFSNGLWRGGTAQALIQGKRAYKRLFIRNRNPQKG